MVALVAASERNEDDPIILGDESGIRSVAALPWIAKLPKGTLKTAFAFNYDVTMILRDLPAPRLDSLRQTNVLRTGRWSVRHIPGKRFWVSDRGLNRSAQIWDVWSWYPYSFNRLLEEWNLATRSEQKFIREMKAARDRFSELPLSRIIEYSVLECRLLARWVRNLIELHTRVGLSLRSYCGPGSTASAIYTKHNWKPPLRSDEITSVATAAFYGGRNEVSCIGDVPGPVYAYDIGSAYPFEISRLPEVVSWRTSKTDPGNEWWGYAAIEWDIQDESVWGPFPVRGAMLESGRALSLVYPLQGKGVYHSSEVNAARSIFGDAITIRRAWIADTTDVLPFSWVNTLAAERLALKAAKDPAAYPLKVGLNSLYGKMVQRKGKAPYRDMVYGAAVTAGTRARLLPILTSLQSNAILAATDGIVTTKKVRGLQLGTNLGEWEVDEYGHAFVAQSGVYWLGDKIRTRGFRRHSLNLAEVKEAWQTEGTQAAISYTERRFIGYRLACARGKAEQAGTWAENTRRLFLSPFPRRVPFRMKGARLLTRPPDLLAWRLHSFFDSVSLHRTNTTELDTSLSMLEDPEWNLDDA